MTGEPPRIRLDEWEGATAAQLAAVWQLPAVHLFATVDSTNDIARELAEAGAATGTTVISETQSAGRGRVGRGWSSAPALGLWMSVVHRPMVESDTLPLRVALAVADALDAQLQRPRVSIKWPNDLLIDDRKVGGILCEASWAGQELASIVIGIGLNLLHAESDFPAEVRGSATSLRLAAGEPVSRFAVAGEIAAGLRPLLNAPLDADLHRRLSARDYLRGRNVDVLEPESGRILFQGRAAGISQNGTLRIDRSGALEEVRSGTIRVRGLVPM